MIWYDGPIELHTCPVLAFTPEVEAVIALFDRTHDLVTDGFGGARWARTQLPDAGGVHDQDARLMEGLDVVRDVAMRVLIADQQRQQRAVKSRHRHSHAKRDDDA